MSSRPDFGWHDRATLPFTMRRLFVLIVIVLAAFLFVDHTAVRANSFTVNSTADVVDANPGDGVCETATPGECTLRAAVQEANAFGGDDEITLPAGTYTLTLAGSGDGGGDLDHGSCCDRVTITGAGSAVTTISAAGLGDRIFDIQNGTLTLTGVTLTGGNVVGHGGAILFSETSGGAELSDVVITGNSATASGGGVYIGTGSLSVVNSTISNNQAGGDGGGIFTSLMTNVILENSQVSGNTAVGGGNGLGLEGGTANVTLLDTSTADNISLASNAQLILDGAIGGSLDGVIDGVGTVTKIGTGTYTLSQWNNLSGPNPATGPFDIQAGILHITHPLALGNFFNGVTTVQNGATLLYDGQPQNGVYYMPDWRLTLNGAGVNGQGALHFVAGGAGFQGPITLATDSTIRDDAPSYNPDHLQGAITGPGSLTKTGSGRIMLHTGTNTYGGATIVQQGDLNVHVSGAIPATSDVTVAAGASLSIGDYPDNFAFPSGPVNQTVATLQGSGQIYLGGPLGAGALTVGNASDFTFDGTFADSGGVGSLIKTGAGAMILTHPGGNWAGSLTIQQGVVQTENLAGNANIALGAASLTVNMTADGVYNGVISGTGGLIKTGANTLTLTGANTFSGLTDVQAGRLNINGTHAGNVAVTGAGAALGGTGTINGTVSVAAAGFLSPGNSPGILNVGDTTLTAGSTFEVEITGNTPGVGGYDQLNVTGFVVIDTGAPGVTLSSLFPAPPYTPQLGDQYVIINNDDSDLVTGTFAGLPEGATINADFGGSLYSGVISYVGGDGNDVVITVITVQRTFVVNATADTDDGTCNALNCTLREAINAANAHVNAATPDAIHFNIPGAGPHTVQPTTALPAITNAVIIDGSTDPNGAIGLDGSLAGAGVPGLAISSSGSALTGLGITGFSDAGVSMLAGTGNVFIANRIHTNGGLGIDLGNDGVTRNDFLDADGGPNQRQNAPILQRVYAALGGLRVQGVLNSAANTTYRVDLYANTTCDRSFYGEGESVLGQIAVTTNAQGNGYFSTLLPTQPNGVALTATATQNPGTGLANTSEFSQCAVVGPNNDTWANAYPVSLTPVAVGESSGSASQYISASGQTRWFKFAAAPNSTVIIDLSSLPANYDLTLFRDIAKTYDRLRQPQDVNELALLSAEFAPEMFTPEMFTPEMFTPEMFTPEMFTPEMFTPEMFTPEMFTPEMFTPEMFTPEMFTPEMFTPEMFTPEMFTPEMFTPEMFTPEMFTPEMFTPEMFTPDRRYYAGALAQSAVAVSAFEGTAPESAVANTWNESGEFYVNVTGRNGAYDPTAPFDLRVTVLGAECNGLTVLDAAPNLGILPNGGYATLFLVDSQRMGVDYSAIASQLNTLAGHPAVNGVIVDVSQFSEIAAANAQADQLYQCVYAKNIVAYGIKAVVDAYRAANPSLRYIVPVGNDDVIPFFRYPDQALLANESGYVPPVLETTASQASLRHGYGLSQDTYGAAIELQRRNTRLPLPELAVGRLVETPAEINATIAAFLASNGTLPTPSRALVTGYDFLSDAATAIQQDLTAGLGVGGSVTPLIDAATTAPVNGWTADDLRTALLESGRHDLIYLGGHFSSFSALAADNKTRVLASELLASSVDMRNAIIFSNGCHSGYNLVAGHAVPNVSIEPDWAQVFAAKGAILIAGTGYQYGDTDFTEYGERLYFQFSRELRRGSGVVSVGEALVRAKQVYLSETAEMRPIHEKTLLTATLFGLPMTTVDMPGERYNPASGVTLVSLTPVATNPGAMLGLKTYDLTVTPNLVRVDKPLQNIVDNSLTNTVYYQVANSDRLVINPGEPVLPLDLHKLRATDTLVRGLGFRGGSYTDVLNVIPLTGAATTELRGIHTPFISSVFYPVTPWDVNYFDTLANSVAGGFIGVGAIPAQFRSNGPSSVDGTMRVYNSMNFRLFYSSNTAAYENQTYDITNIPALAGPPAISKVTSAANGGVQVAFRVTVTGDPSAGIQAVWVTYTSDQAPLAGQWQSLDLSQDPNDSRDWVGVLDLQGTSSAHLRYMVQAANGVGLVSLNTNKGAYFLPDTDPATPSARPEDATPPDPVELVLLSPTSSGEYGTDVTFSARLTRNGAPLVGETLEFGLTSQRQSAVTGANGIATVTLTVIGDPADDTIRVTYPGAPGLTPAANAAPFTIQPIPTLLQVLTQTPTFSTGGPADLSIALTDATGRPQPYKSVLIVVTNGGGGVAFAQAVQTDLYGNAHLRTVNLADGSYQVHAYFASRVTLPGIGTVDMRLPRFTPIQTPAIGQPPVVIRTNTPPVARPGGPYDVNEGGSVVLNGSASSDADAGQVLTFAWDLNHNSGFEVQGPTPTMYATMLNGPASDTVRLRVCDPIECTIATATLNIRNVPPTIISIANNGPADPNQTVTISVTADDPVDVLNYSFDCDNNGVYEIGPQASSQAGCSYTMPGNYTVRVRVQDGAAAVTGTTIVNIKAKEPPTVNAGPDLVGFAGVSLAFAGSYTNPQGAPPYTFTWTFGDGGTATGALNPLHTYNTTGVFTAKLTVRNGYNLEGSDTARITILPNYLTYCILAGNDMVKLDKDSTFTNCRIGAAQQIDVKASSTFNNSPLSPMLGPISWQPLNLTAGTQKIQVEKNGTETLAPGSYGNLEMKDGATLILTDGHYRFQEFKTHKNPALVFNLGGGSIVIDVVGDVEFGDEARFSINGGDASDVLFRSMGNHLKLKKDGQYLGTFLAPQAKITLEKGNTLTGALFGKAIDIDKENAVTYRLATDAFVMLYGE